MSVIERAEKRLQEEIRQNDLGADNLPVQKGGRSMTDHTELVKKLRDLHRDPRPASAVWLFDNQVALYDAAAAIEELQQIADHHEQTAKDYWKEACEYKAQMPKRGEWIEIEDYDGDFHYQCSVCGEEWYFIDGTPADNNANYCPRCGAKMEVQYADK